jgi:hypothetical protein
MARYGQGVALQIAIGEFDVLNLVALAKVRKSLQTPCGLSDRSSRGENRILTRAHRRTKIFRSLLF